jgi:hypothetical protein
LAFSLYWSFRQEPYSLAFLFSASGECVPNGMSFFMAKVAMHGFSQRVFDAPIEWSGVFSDRFFAVFTLEIFLEI